MPVFRAGRGWALEKLNLRLPEYLLDIEEPFQPGTVAGETWRR